MKNKLCALILGAGKTKNKSTIEKITKNINSLYWQKNSFLNNDIHEIYFIGGYRFNLIDKNTKNIKFLYNKNWKKNIIETLNAFKFYNETIITYADTLHDFNTIKKIKESNANLTICVDSNWLDRYENRSFNDKFVSERYSTESKNFVKNSKNFLNQKEFTGLIKISKKLIPVFSKIIKKRFVTNIPDLLNELINIENSIEIIDVKGSWCEFNSSQDKKNFFLKSKHDTTFKVSKSIPEIKFLNQLLISKENWIKNKKDLTKKIIEKFGDKKVIIRSSSLLEDKDNQSNAGKYLSIGNILTKNKNSLRVNISKVFDSYKIDNPEDVIFIQEYVDKVDISGVLFTRTLGTNLPYYVCNYDNRTGRTDTITSGSNFNSKTFYVLKNKINLIKNKNFKKLLTIANKIEQLTSQKNLDIEFAIKNKNIFIFQTRFLFVNKNNISDKEFYKIAEKNYNSLYKYFKKAKNYSNQDIILSNMADWNPAEILGLNPSNLATSIYRELITDKIWGLQRKNIGNFFINKPLMETFNGRNFINCTYSIMSFIPKNLNNSLRKKIVKSSIKSLKNKNYLHDKIEFEIVKTCYDLNFDVDAKNKYSFLKKNEINSLKKAYIKTTKKTFQIEEKVQLNLYKLQNTWNAIKKLKINDFNKILKILPILKKYGTLVFANSARSGFISISILKSLLKKNFINQKQYDNFMLSLKTISKDYLEDIYLLKKRKINIKTFLSKYGHLRPNTYNIESKKYSDLNFREIIENLTAKRIKPKNFNFSTSVLNKINTTLKNDNFNHDVNYIINFLKVGIQNREFTKLIFTKVLSEILDMLKNYSKKNKIDLNKFSNLNFKDILNLNNKSKIKKKILIQNKLNQQNNILLLPDVINSPSDVYKFEVFEKKGNFITNKVIKSKIVYLDNNQFDKKLKNKIVIIQSADPGYDWIFSYKISGLITQYGGANSHMAIRCAELNIPASIGVGEDIFSNLKKSDKILLDCNNNQIIYE